MDSFSFRDRQRSSTRNIQPSLKTRKAPLKGISYVNTPLAKHEDDAAPFTHWNKINNLSRDELRFQTVFSTNREAMKSNASQHSSFGRAREQKARKWSMKREKRDSAWSVVIKTFPLYEPITDRTVVWTTGYRQTSRQTHRQTKAFFTVGKTLSFQSR